MATLAKDQTIPDETPVQEAKEIEVFADVGGQVMESVGSSALEAYGEREVVRELVSRLMKFHPAAKEVGKSGMIMAAQLAILMGASPIPGTNEIHIWKDNRNNVIVAPGINYWERRARQQGGIFWDIEPRPMTEDERRRYSIPPNDLGAICRGVRLADLTEWIGKGLPAEVGIRGFGRIGLGVVSTKTYSWKDNVDYTERKQGRPLIWTAIKRARTDTLKNLYPIIPGERINGGPGMVQDDDGAFRPNYDAHWTALDARILEQELAPGEPTDESVSEYLWGSEFGIDASPTDIIMRKAEEERSDVDATGELKIIESEIVDEDEDE